MPHTTSPIDKDQLQSDHDVLVELRTEFRGFKEAVTTGLKEVKDSLDSQHATMNARLIILETFVTKNDLETKVKRWDRTAAWVESYQGRWKWIAGAIGLASGIFVYFVDHILPLLRLK